jgi:anti-sigma B factor antagonist
MNIEETMQNGTCVVRVTGRLDAVTAPELDKAVMRIIADLSGGGQKIEGFER